MDIDKLMNSGQIYDPTEERFTKRQAECLEILYDFNQTRPSESEKRQLLLQQLFAEIGSNCYIEPPLRANWGCHTHMGNSVYVNFNLTLVDDADVFIGDHTMIGPNVTIATANHPLEPALREKALQYNTPVHIGKNVWIGAGAILLPGVHIGDHSIIGAGSIVTKDIPSMVVAVGNPCRILKQIDK